MWPIIFNQIIVYHLLTVCMLYLDDVQCALMAEEIN